jgi:hypothetical protein
VFLNASSVWEATDQFQDGFFLVREVRNRRRRWQPTPPSTSAPVTTATPRRKVISASEGMIAGTGGSLLLRDLTWITLAGAIAIAFSLPTEDKEDGHVDNLLDMPDPAS